jgi:hypothetical protein
MLSPIAFKQQQKLKLQGVLKTRGYSSAGGSWGCLGLSASRWHVCGHLHHFWRSTVQRRSSIRSDVKAILAQDMEAIDLARAKLELDRLVMPSVHVEVELAQIDAMAAALAATIPAGADSWGKAEVLRRYLYEAGPWNDNRPFSYDMADPYGKIPGNKLLADYLDDRQGNCVTMPILMIVLGQRIRLDITAASAPIHVLVKFRDDAGKLWNLGRFDGFHSVPASVSKTCTVRFDNNKYSVLATAVGRPVEVHAYAERIIIRQDGVVVAEHARAFGRGQTVYDPWHYVPVLARKPGALRNGAPFKDWVLPPAMAAIRRKLKGSDDGDRQMVQILSCVPDDGLQAVEAACREAVDQGVHSAPVVINILARRRDPTPPPLLLTPTALRLTHEPVADCARYDSLRRTSRHGTHPNLRPDGQPQTLRDAQRL